MSAPEIVDRLMEHDARAAARAYEREVQSRLAADETVDRDVVEMDVHDDCAEYHEDRYGGDFEAPWATLVDKTATPV